MVYPVIFPLSKRDRKRMTIMYNRRKGKTAEEIVKWRYLIMGYDVERTGRGHDFRVRKRDLFTARVIDSKYIEVKSGNAKLSKLQQEMKRKKRNYKVERVDPLLW